MNTHENTHARNHVQRGSIGSAVHEILQESRKRRVVIRNRTGKQIIDISTLLALILSIGASVLPAFVILGVLVESIRVSFERN
ncbi:MAG: DUF4342 domain-containing protein [Anaerolineales bacterium]